MAKQNACAIITIDPGVTTGFLTALVDLGQPTVAACIRRCMRKGHLNTSDIKGDYVSQCLDIYTRIKDFWYNSHIEKGYVMAGHMCIAIEDFQLRQMAVDLTPMRILNGLEVMLAAGHGIQFIDDDANYKKQQPQKKGFCSDEMLKNWGLWKKRSPHQRDAIRHLAVRLDGLLA